MYGVNSIYIVTCWGYIINNCGFRINKIDLFGNTELQLVATKSYSYYSIRCFASVCCVLLYSLLKTLNALNQSLNPLK
jgi:hypothetical protein